MKKIITYTIIIVVALAVVYFTHNYVQTGSLLPKNTKQHEDVPGDSPGNNDTTPDDAPPEQTRAVNIAAN